MHSPDREADVVIESFTPGVMSRLGLGYDDLDRPIRLLQPVGVRPGRPARQPAGL